ncbi:unnamed protein product [Caenorhabditis bovis]|uniref:Nitrogen permease regulator 2-like protein n=1 Tax=Caenorhabditis bovis TaxID=2654633 RepID=A0A8S1F6S8_9PELO|nr:unnamed protein product [Caenorhabditis bovis]
MVKRMKSLATFGAGPFATGDSDVRFGHYDYDDVPRLLAIFYAEFDNDAGPIIRHQVPANFNLTRIFQPQSGLIIPKSQLICRSMKCSLKHENCRVLGYPVKLSHQGYRRQYYIFNMCFVVAWESVSDSMYEPIVQKCAEYLIELEQEFSFLSNRAYNAQCGKKTVCGLEAKRLVSVLHTNKLCESEIRIIAPELAKVEIKNEKENEKNEKAKEDSVAAERNEDYRKVGVSKAAKNLMMTLYFKLCPSYRGVEPPEVSIFMVPMFIRGIKLTSRVIDGMDVLSQKIIPQIDGIRTVKEIAFVLNLDPALVARCVRNLHFYECVSLVPMFLYSNTYVATERVHDFYMNQTEITDCMDFVKIQNPEQIEDDGEPPPVPQFSDVFRLYLSMKCGMTLAEWVRVEQPRSMGIDEHRLVQFGMHHQFLRKLTVYPICTVSTGGNKFLSSCNGKTSIEELSLEHNLDPQVLYQLLAESNKFEFVMK